MKKFNMQDPRTRRLSSFFVIAMLLLLGACSSLRLAYNNSDTLLYWWVDAYVDLDAEQKAEVKSDIDGFFRWHRKTQLQDYVQVLRTAQKQLQGNISLAELAADYKDVRARTQSLLLKAVPDMADLALSLRPDQIAQMEQKFEKNNRDFRKKNMKGDRDAQLKYRYKKSMEQFELWFGSFTNEQEDIIRKASDARPLDNALWLDERMRRQRNILALVRKIQQERPSEEATQGMIRDLIRENFERMERSERKPFFDAYTESTMQLILTVIKIATPVQKEHALRRMQGWIDDFNVLSAQVR